MRLEPGSLRLLRRAGESLLLGVVTEAEEVILREAGKACPGHREWLRSKPQLRAAHGFSVTVVDGLVTEVYRASIVNGAARDGLLEPDVLDRLMSVLPVAEDVTVYGH